VGVWFALIREKGAVAYQDESKGREKMQKIIRVFVLGTNPLVLSFFRRHRQEYQLLRQEGQETSLSIVGEQQPHLVVLAGDDLRLCQRVHSAWPTVPLVMVSANTSALHIARALDLGADDYITLPFGEDEFLARLRALVRRTHARLAQNDAEVLTSQDGKIVLNVAKHECTVCGREVDLTATEFALLRLFLAHSEQILSHRFLLQQVWGPEYSEEREYLRVYMGFAHEWNRKLE
jgi:two-component system, OmpR family, KDP operon response regulator KdpE